MSNHLQTEIERSPSAQPIVEENDAPAYVLENCVCIVSAPSEKLAYRSPKVLDDELQAWLKHLQKAKLIDEKLALVCNALFETTALSFSAAALFGESYSVQYAHLRAVEGARGGGIERAFREHFAAPADARRVFYDYLLQEKKYRLQNIYCYETAELCAALERQGVAFSQPFPNAPAPVELIQEPVLQKRKAASKKIPLEILFAAYNKKSRGNKPFEFGIVLPMFGTDGKIIGAIFSGESLRNAVESQEQVLELQRVLDRFVKQASLSLEEALREAVMKASLPKASEKVVELPPNDELPPATVEPKTALQQALELSRKISERQTITEKIDLLGQATIVIGNVKSCAIALYGQDDEIEYHKLYTRTGAEHVKSEILNPDFAYSRYLSEALVSCKGFRAEQSYCCKIAQLEKLQTAIESGMEAPREFYSETESEDALKKLHSRDDIVLITPLKIGGTLLGYVAIDGDSISLIENTENDLADRLRLMGILVNEISGQLLQAKLRAESNRYALQTETLRDLLDVLFTTSAAIQAAKTLDEKFQLTAQTIVNELGFTSATLVTYNESGVISLSAVAVHLEAEDQNLAKRLTTRYAVGRRVQSDTLNMVFSAKFSVGHGYAFSSRDIRILRSSNAETNNANMGQKNLNVFLSGKADVGLWFPLYDEAKRLAGFIRLGKWMLPNDERVTAEFMERLRIIALFAERLSQDYSLSKLEAQRTNEITEKQRFNKALALLFEAGTKISQSPSIQEKLRLSCKALVETTDLDFTGICLYDVNGEVCYTDHYEKAGIDEKIAQAVSDTYAVGKKINTHAYNALFEREEFKLHPFNVYCADLRQLKRLLDADAMQAIGTTTKGIIDVNDDDTGEVNSMKNLERYLETMGTPESDYYTLVVPIRITDRTAVPIKGFITLGNFTECETTADILNQLVAIDLFVSVIESDITNFFLAQTLAQESQQLFQRSLFIQKLLELDVKLSQPISLHDKIRMVCESSVEQSSFRYVLAALIDKNRQVLSDFHYMEHPELIAASDDQPSKGIAPLIQSFSQGVAIYEPAFVELSLSERNRVKDAGNAYCYDLRWLIREMQQRGIAVPDEKKILPSTNIDAEPLTAEQALRVFWGGTTREDVLVNFIIPLTGAQGRLLGFISLGRMLARVKKSYQEVLDDVRLIELIAGSLASHLENLELNQNLSASEAKFRNVVENVGYGFVISDKDGRIEYVNAFLKRILVRGDDAIIGHLLEDLSHPETLLQAKRQRSIVYSGRTPSEEELLLLTSSGEAIPFQVSSSPQLVLHNDGEVTVEGSFSVLVDLRKQREIERQKIELETIRNNFFAMVVHDMKVPLSAIYGYSEMLRDADPNKMESDHFKKIMGQIHLSSSNITSLVQEILDFSKYEAKMVKLNRSLSSLQLCLELVLEQNQFDLGAKGMTVRKEIERVDFTFYFDFDKIVRVISNLVSNAIKFSHKGSEIVASLERFEHRGTAFAKLTIRDNGEGIAPEEVGYIFDAYRQANSKHGSRGTGLGLSIAKQVVELHGGKIWAESKLGEGTAITFALPMTTNPD